MWMTSHDLSYTQQHSAVCLAEAGLQLLSTSTNKGMAMVCSLSWFHSMARTERSPDQKAAFIKALHFRVWCAVSRRISAQTTSLWQWVCQTNMHWPLSTYVLCNAIACSEWIIWNIPALVSAVDEYTEVCKSNLTLRVYTFEPNGVFGSIYDQSAC